MILVHKIELQPNRAQAQYFARAAGTARFAYNWALARWKEEYEAGNTPSESKLRKELNSIKREQFPWMLEVTKVAPQTAIKNVGVAFDRFFKKLGKYPQFKKKGINDSFRADNGPQAKGVDAVPISGKRIKLPKIGEVRMRERVRFQGQVKSVTISRRADRWFAAIAVEAETLPHVRKNHGTCGIDLGVKTLATFSDGRKVEGPKAHKALLDRMRWLSRSLSRKQKGSANRRKAKVKLAKLHARITNIRTDALHKLTTDTVLNHTIIGIENLNVKGMAANRRLARHVMDQSFYEFRRQLEYKARWYGSIVHVADRWFPSSKLCSACGAINTDLVLGVSQWVCECGADHDRDENAAINLERLAASSAVSVCGPEGSGAALAAA
jgi:putative transposase